MPPGVSLYGYGHLRQGIEDSRLTRFGVGVGALAVGIGVGLAVGYRGSGRLRRKEGEMFALMTLGAAIAIASIGRKWVREPIPA